MSVTRTWQRDELSSLSYPFVEPSTTSFGFIWQKSRKFFSWKVLWANVYSLCRTRSSRLEIIIAHLHCGRHIIECASKDVPFGVVRVLERSSAFNAPRRPLRAPRNDAASNFKSDVRIN